MKTSVLIVAGADKRLIAQAIEAANGVFPGASVGSANSLKEALATEPSPAQEIIVLADAEEAGIREATQALDAANLPRWAVVATGSSAPVPFAEVIPVAELNSGKLARAFRSAAAINQLRRERDRLRADLLSIGIRISHDLRSPMGGIISSTEVLDATGPERPKNEKSPTQPIFESANDLVKVINQLTLVTKATARPDTRQKFNMAGPMGRALERVEMKVRQTAATISKPASWPELVGDPTFTELAWLGLLENALRHAGKSPTIELGWDQDEENYTFWIRDHGPGVPVEKRRQLFHPFHRLHEPNAARGLGLPIVGRLVQLQGGTCGYEPLTPAGSRFFFKLPRQ
jgi:K+-sensing histidine kinase KdpD